MSFEQKCNDYLLLLKAQGVLLDADLYGVNEDFKTAHGKARFTDTTLGVIEKRIHIREVDGQLTWSYFTPLEPEA
jgi:hypothetical protein